MRRIFLQRRPVAKNATPRPSVINDLSLPSLANQPGSLDHSKFFEHIAGCARVGVKSYIIYHIIDLTYSDVTTLYTGCIEILE